MENMKSFADNIIAVANNNNLLVSNLQLQKVMYFLLRYVIRHKIFNLDKIKDIYDEPFLVWRYGPVVESIYEEYKIFGPDPIIQSSSQIPIFHELTKEIIKLLKIPVFNLVNKSHQDPYWEINSTHIIGWRSNIKYSLYNVETGQ